MIKINSNLDSIDLISGLSVTNNQGKKELLLSAIQSGMISSYFQPIVDLLTSSVYGYEMLARGEGEFFDPGVMFEIAKDNKIEWELEYACRIAALNKICVLDESFDDKYFFLNVSPNIFYNPEFQSGFTSKFIKEHGLNHRQIVLEITETVTIEHYDIFEKLIKHYVEQGFKVALDDFGAGHSGLTTLVAMTPHFMKIDREIIKGINNSPYKQKLLKTLCNFASDVGSNILAEGIEDFEDLETVYRLGVRYVQGYYLGKPAPTPGLIRGDKQNELEKLSSRFRISEISSVSFLNDIIIKPDVFSSGSLLCRELDIFFKRNQMIDHVVVTADKYPVELITRQKFYKSLSGRFGFSLYAEHTVEELFHNDFLMLKNDVDLLTIKKIALNRNGNDAFDPIIIIDSSGVFIGTITMKKLIKKAIDLEILNAINQNPLTLLPGNGAIQGWLEQISLEAEYTVVYIDIDHFKQFNDTYGFSNGDKMITLLADILKEFRTTSVQKINLGHIGGDDFILVLHCHITVEFLSSICDNFDTRKIDIFTEKDVINKNYQAVNREGQIKSYPLTTISLAAFSNKNFIKTISPSELGHYAAELKSKVKKGNYLSGRSGFIYERRIH